MGGTCSFAFENATRLQIYDLLGLSFVSCQQCIGMILRQSSFSGFVVFSHAISDAVRYGMSNECLADLFFCFLAAYSTSIRRSANGHVVPLSFRISDVCVKIRYPISFTFVQKFFRYVAFQNGIFEVFNPVFFNGAFEDNALVVTFAILSFACFTIEYGLSDIGITFMLFVFVPVNNSCSHIFFVC